MLQASSRNDIHVMSHAELMQCEQVPLSSPCSLERARHPVQRLAPAAK